MSAAGRNLSVALSLFPAVVGIRPAVAQFPTTPPPAGALRPFQSPAVSESALPNGLRVVVVENHELPILSLSLSLRGGGKDDAPGREGVATLMAELLTKGTKTRTADQIASQIESTGGSLSADATADAVTLSANGLVESAALMFQLMGDVTVNPTFPASEFELARTRLTSSLQYERSDPQALAERFFAQALFRDHPYGRRASEESVRSISRDDVAVHAAKWLKPSGALLVITGDISAADARRLATRHLGDWRGTAPSVEPPVPPAAHATRIILVNRTGSVQSSVVMGNLVFPVGDPRHYALLVANRILGAGADSRLFRVLREQKSWSHDVRSEVARRVEAGHFFVAAQVREPVTDQALSELADQLHRLQTEPVADSELAGAKGYVLGSFPRQVETPQQVAAQVANAKLLGLGDDYVRTFRDRIASLTVADVQATARAAIKPESAVVVVVGDGQKLYGRLKTMGPVDIVDAEGKPLAAADLGPKVGPLKLDRQQFVSRRDSFLVFVQGNPLGSMIAETRAGGDSLIYHEKLALPVARWSLETTARLDLGSFEMRSLDQSGQMATQPAATHLVFAGGRVKGRAQIPQPGGTPKITQVDTTVSQGVIDQNAVSLIVPALPLEPQTSYVINTFDATDGSVKPVTVTVTAAGNLGVPAGLFSVFQVQVTGIPNPAFLYVTRDSPRRVVKVEQIGRPMSFELAK